jgi:hypothetical protein
MRCCRRRNARAAAMTAAALRRRHRRGEAQINQCPPGGSATIRRARPAAGPAVLPLNPRTASSRRRASPGSTRRAASAARAACRPARSMPSSAPQIPAHRARRSLHGLRAVPAALPGRLHRDAARAGARADQPRTKTARATRRTRASRPAQRAPTRARRAKGRRARARCGRREPAKRRAIFRAAARRESRAAHRAALPHAVRTAGRGDPLGAGHRQERQQGDGRPVPRSPIRRPRCSRWASPDSRHIKSIGLYNSKAKNIIATCRGAGERHGGEVPRTREALERCRASAARPPTWS